MWIPSTRAPASIRSGLIGEGLGFRDLGFRDLGFRGLITVNSNYLRVT